MQARIVAPQRAFVQARPVVVSRAQVVAAPRAEHPMDPNVNWQAFKKHENDVGSTQLQVAMMSARITHLTNHLRQNRKDHACSRGLMQLLGRRKRMLQYLYNTDKPAFARAVRELNIRNPIKSLIFVKDKDKATTN